MNRATRRHALIIALAVLGSTSLAACTAPDRPGTSAAAADLAGRPELKSFYSQKLTWSDCGDFECAKLTVPMDYAHPANGKTFVLPVAKSVTADPDRRIGTLVYNPGGPGLPGVQSLKDGIAESISKKVRNRFDIVSFDPRGVGQSSPALTCEDDQEEATDDGAEDTTSAQQPLYPQTETDQQEALASAQAEADACRANSGPLLRHVGTPDAARDMDVLRAALGEGKLTYIGWSYGTSLGTSYAEQFPRRVRALVLDGAIDPSQDWSALTIGQAVSFQQAVDDYATYCADIAEDSCPGSTPEEISALIDDLYEQTEREPLPVDGDEYGLDATMLLTAITESMYTPEDQWPDLSEALGDAADGDGTKMAGLYDEQLSEAEDWEPSGPADSSDGPADETDEAGDDSQVPVDNSEAALQAVSCLDTPHPRSERPYWDALETADKAAGIYGTSAVMTALTCKGWPTGTMKPHKVNAAGVPPVLVVGTTGDPATPYEDAVSLADQFPGGMLLTYEGLGHTAYGRSNACVTNAVDDYLLGLEKVAPGTTC
ncbi:alpha/beta hydrolase [Streptomyces sp. WAC 01529]|uniref:alpha/beta hydrolase n=1 Tax=Streptomyces sp. WAC 01529 TaxID=2203205 RepID=UPI000F6DD9F3|nr:alpha/beta hydrolase [Streptomyces sp. WAC 01529]AZM56283.1 alpha/beta hydrolase [Streptomyces sp. WAC 01529]